LLFSLLLANLLFLAWITWIDRASPAPANAGTVLPALQVLPAADAPASNAPANAPVAAAAPAAGAAAARSAAQAPAAASRCNSLGPLADADVSRGVQVALEGRKLSGRERTVIGEELEGYWVHLDRLGDEAARTRAIHRLQVAGIHGAVALAETSQVAVGLFSEQDAAEQRAAAVRKLGYKVDVGPRNHVVTRYWLDVEAPNAVPMPTVDALLGGLRVASTPTWQPCATAVPAATAGEPPASSTPDNAAATTGSATP
jgi:hypothetical protein